MKGKVLLAMTLDSQIYECVKDGINYMGKECELLNTPINEKKINSKPWTFKLKLFFKLHIEKNKNYIKKYDVNNYEKNIIKKIQNEGSSFESCLMIRPDLYSEEIIDTLVSSIKKTYAYQWDGLDRFPEVLKMIPKFKHFYIYDKKDINRFPNTSLTNNFYFDCYKHKNKKNPAYDVYYVGSYDNRINDIIDICTKLDKLGLKMKILILCSKENRGKLNEYPFITEIKKVISYYENLENVFDCKILLDFGHKNTHTGLSLRPLEALGYNKKLITNNEIIKDYDFYNEENSLVIDENITTKKLQDFIGVNYKTIEQEIYNKYSFSNWFNKIMK